MGKSFLYTFSTLAFVLFSGSSLAGQEVDSLMVKVDSLDRTLEVVDSVSVPLSPEQLLNIADSLREAYRFSEAVGMYEKARAAASDSLLIEAVDDRLILGQNALSMMDYCSHPVVVAKQKFSLKDFFLFYPLKDKSWRALPNQLDSLDGHPIARAMYVPDDAKTLYYGAKDEDGISNIYRTVDLGEIWSVPELINEQVTSSSDEIFPMLSPDGRSLFFASKGLYGMGGYDLYVSRWNKESKDWDVPVNMGFPYSSPADDFLFINTADGKYSIFASNRECSRDSVYIYVLEFDSMPVRKAVRDEDELYTLSQLSPAVDPSRIDNASAVKQDSAENEATDRYRTQMLKVRALRDSISNYGTMLNRERAAAAELDSTDREAALAAVFAKEMALPALSDTLAKAVSDLQKIEMDFLVSGISVDSEKIRTDLEKEVVGVSSGYAFSKNSFGPALEMNIEKPEPTFDYTFMILPEGRFAEDNTLPSGLVYQIQLFTSSSKAKVSHLKGLSPVFEKLSPSLKYTYSVGVFRSYKDALSNLNKVKRLGFRTAMITAYKDGKSMSVAAARSLESSVKTIYTVKIYPDDGETLPDLAKTAIHNITTRDIVRSVEEGAVVYLAGPFDEKSDAESLVTALKATGVGNAVIDQTTLTLNMAL
ncbi:MAG: hypothetical protein K5984_00425 [Bacteroidales bacterium]|nr:hypothetical protein [Bacteroidales bacterium]